MHVCVWASRNGKRWTHASSARTCVEINQCVGCTREFFTKRNARKFDFHTGVDVVRRAVGEGPVRVARARLGREVVVSLHIRVYYERAGFGWDGQI